MDYCPFVDYNTGMLYFTSRRSTVNKKTTYRSIEKLVQEINKYENGNSRIYKVSIKDKYLPAQKMGNPH